MQELSHTARLSLGTRSNEKRLGDEPAQHPEARQTSGRNCVNPHLKLVRASTGSALTCAIRPFRVGSRDSNLSDQSGLKLVRNLPQAGEALDNRRAWLAASEGLPEVPPRPRYTPLNH